MDVTASQFFAELFCDEYGFIEVISTFNDFCSVAFYGCYLVGVGSFGYADYCFYSVEFAGECYALSVVSGACCDYSFGFFFGC